MLILFCNYELIKKLILTVVHHFDDDVWKYVEFGIFEIKKPERRWLGFQFISPFVIKRLVTDKKFRKLEIIKMR